MLLTNNKQLNKISLDIGSEDISKLIEQLKESCNNLILDSGPTGAMLLNFNKGHFVHVNPMIKKLIGLPANYKGEINWYQLKKLIPEQDTFFFDKIIDQFNSKAKQVSIFELQRWLSNGELRCFDKKQKLEKWFRYRVLVLVNKNASEEIYLLYFLTDISLLEHSNILSWYLYNTHTKKMIDRKSKLALPLTKNSCTYENLTERELDVVRLISEGLTNSQISEKLYVTKNTIKTHRQRIYEKLKVRKSSEMVKVCMNRGLI